jgi:hypothetical protein
MYSKNLNYIGSTSYRTDNLRIICINLVKVINIDS